MAALGQVDTFRIVIEGTIDENNVSNQNVVYNALNTFVSTTIPGLGAGIKMNQARYQSTVYPKSWGETVLIPAGIGAN
jgi:hypothetical protein